MRNNRIVIGALSLVLLAGAAIGVWLVLQDDPGRTDTMVAADGDRYDGAGDDRPPIGDTDSTEPADGAARADTETIDANETPVPDNTNDATAPAGSTDEPTETDPGIDAHKDWEENSREILITGKVTFKHDGRPAAGAEVRAMAVDRTDFGPWGSNGDAAPIEDEPDRPEARISGRTTSDGAGEFSFSVNVTGFATPEGLESDPLAGVPRAVHVIATMPGYAPARSQRILVYWTDGDEQVELELAVPMALKGRVVDVGTQEGIAGAQIALWDFSDSGSVDNRYLTTDEDGRFAINNLPESNWSVRIQADGYARWNSSSVLSLKVGDECDLGDIALHPTAKIFGLVVDETTGEGVPDADVSLESTGRRGFGGDSATTGGDGKFQMTSVDPGTYTLRADADGYAPTDVENVRVSSSEQLHVGTIKLGRGLTIHGCVRNENKDAITGAAIEVVVVESDGFMGDEDTLAETTSESDGAFEISGLKEGDFTLQVKAAGYAEYRESIKVTGDGGEFDVTLSRGGVITGRVLDTDSRPVPGQVCVTLDHKSQEYSLYKLNPEMIGFGLPRHGHETDAAGRFEIALLPEGTYLFAVMDQENDRRILHDDVVVKNNEVTDLGDLRFEAPGNVRVTVTENGRPVPDLRVGVAGMMDYSARGDYEATTDSTGTALIEGVPAGRWVVRTEREERGFDTDRSDRSVKVVPGKTVEFRLELQPADRAHLHGRLTINGESVFKDITLMGRGEREGVFKNTEAEQGHYEFLSLRPGTYTLFARESGSSVAARLEVNIESPGKREINHDFKGYRVAGRVNTPGNTPDEFMAAGVKLAADGARDSGIERMLIGEADVQSDGSFEFRRVPVGRYVLTATLAGVGAATAPVNVVSGDVAGLALTIHDNAGSVKVAIGSLNGNAIGGANIGMVELIDTEGKPVTLADDQEGFFMASKGANVNLTTIPAGRYSLRVGASGYLPVTKQDIVVETGETTEVSVDLTAGAELHLTVTNGEEITQEILDSATVRYFDAGGSELEVASNLFDSFGATTTPETPTLVARYLHEGVAEVRIKIDGYLELTIPVQPQPGQKIEKQKTLLAE